MELVETTVYRELNEKRHGQWHIQMALIQLAQLAAESSRGLVLPTLFLYCEALGGGLVDMGRATSIFSVGRLVSSILVGWLSDRFSFRRVHLFCSAIGILGNILYILPSKSMAGSMYLLYFSRFLVGFGAGNLSVCRANVAAMTPKSMRLLYMNRLALVVFVGYALSPGVGGLFSHIDFYLIGLHIQALTVPGLILAVFNAITFVCMWFGFDDSISVNDAPLDNNDEVKPVDSEATVPAKAQEEPSSLYFGLAVFLLLNVVGRGVVAVFETIFVPLHFDVVQHSGSHAQSGDAIRSAASFQFSMGLLGLTTYIGIEIARNSISEFAWLVGGLLCFSLGNILLLVHPLSWTQFCFAIYFIWSAGGPIMTAVSVAAFSKVLGTQSQGLWMGYFGSAGSFSRIVLPLLPALFNSFEPMYWINLGLSALGIGLLALFTYSSRTSAIPTKV